MRIVCPSCAAEYEVPASHLAPSRMVRCARCGGKWAAIAEAEELPPVPGPAEAQAEHEPDHCGEQAEALPPMTAMDRLAAPGPRPPRSASLIAAWVMTFIVVTAAVAATITWREWVVRAWPPSGRILGSPDYVTAPAQSPGNAAAVSGPAKE